MTWFNDRLRPKPRNGEAKESVRNAAKSWDDGYFTAYREALLWCQDKSAEEIQEEFKRRYEGQS